MDLEYELSRYKRNMVKIVSHISGQLLEKPILFSDYVDNMPSCDIKDVYNAILHDAKRLAMLDFLNEHIMVYKLDDTTDILVIICKSVSMLMNDECIELGTYVFDDIAKRFVDIGDNRVLMLDYDRFTIWHGRFNILRFKYEYFGYARKFLKLGINTELYDLHVHWGSNDIFTQYIMNNKDFTTLQIQVEIEKRVSENEFDGEWADTASFYLDNYLTKRLSPDGELTSLYMFSISDAHLRLLNFVKDRSSECTRLTTLTKWRDVIENDKDILYIEYRGDLSGLFTNGVLSQEDSPKKLAINMVKELPKLLFYIYSFKNVDCTIDTFVPDYISKDASKFRRPYDIYNNEYFADGNLSKYRAIKKFITAVEKLGINLSDFYIELKED